MRKILLVMVIIFFLITTGCGITSSSPDKGDISEVYIQAIEILIQEDGGLNGDISYIAIDFDTFEGIDEQSKKEIIEYIEENYMKVKDASLDELKEQGEFDEEKLVLKNGILISIDKMNKFSSNKIYFEASKYRSGLGAIGMNFEFKKKGSNWEMIEAKMLWIS